MVGENRAATTARISSMLIPQLTRPVYVDIGQAVKDGINMYYKARGAQERYNERERIKGLEQNLADAVKSGDETAINNAYAQLNPTGYVDYLNRIKANREASDLEFARQKELLDIRNQNAMGLARLKADLGLGSGVNINLNPFDQKRIETIAKNIDENISSSQSKIDDYSRLEQLLRDKDVSTGGVKGAIKENIPTAFLNEKEQEFKAIVKRIIPQMRAPGSGAASDKDMATFEEASPGLSKEKDANLNLVIGSKIANENTIAREELRADWLNRGGSLTEFDKLWRNYLETNRIFTEGSNKLNANRINAYDWFSGKRNTTKQEDSDPLGIL